jgi:nicotinate-nucleotide adenylyltransferase
MKIGLYGGSFNPIHFGHIGLAQWVLANTDLDELWLMVSPNNPLKDSSILADEQVRLQNAKEAIAQLSSDTPYTSHPTPTCAKRIVVSDFEFQLPKPNYTANTLRELQKQYPQHEFSLIIGEDNLLIFDKWRESEFIKGNFRIFVYPRRESTKPLKSFTSESLPSNVSEGEHGFIYLNGAPYFDISSTEIRQQAEKK